MTNTLIDKTYEGLQRQIQRDLTALDRRIGRYPARLMPGGSDVVSSFRGTTAERDALYGIPTTDAEHVALANRQIVWYNTDLGWEESYYSWAGAPGLTVRGLILGTQSGWYPTGPTGPRAYLSTKGAQSRTTGQHFTNYDVFGVGRSWRNCSNDYLYFTTPGTDARIEIVRAGYYNVYGSMGVQNGSGTAVLSIRVNQSGGAGLWNQQYPAPLLASYGQQFYPSLGTSPIPAGAYAFHYLDAGSLSIGQGSTFLAVEYIAPALVSA